MQTLKLVWLVLTGQATRVSPHRILRGLREHVRYAKIILQPVDSCCTWFYLLQMVFWTPWAHSRGSNGITKQGAHMEG